MNKNVVQSQKAKDKYDAWKICCKDNDQRSSGGVLQVYVRYGGFEGKCMVETEYLDFLKLKSAKQNSDPGL